MTTKTNLPVFSSYTTERLTAMGKVYYGSKATPFQASRYEQIRDLLFAELKSLWPDVPDRFAEHNALYLHQIIDRVIWEQNQEERRILAGMSANAHTAHEQLKNWK